MKEHRTDEIIYDEDFRTIDRDETPQLVDTHSEDIVPTKKRNHRFPALITIQLLLCVIAFAVVFMLKAMNSDTYAKLRQWYNDLMNKTLISDSTFEDIDLNSVINSFDNLLTAQSDEV